MRLFLKRGIFTLFPTEWPLKSFAIEILVPIPKNRRSLLFIIVITDRFKKLMQIVPLRPITAYDDAIAFT